MAVLHFSDCDYTVFTSIWAEHKLMGMVFNQARDYVVAEDNPAANPNAG